MNKEDIIFKLSSLNLDKNEYIVIGGTSLVLRGIIKETSDIDLTTSNSYYNKINWPVKNGAFNIEIKYDDCFEISYNLYDEKSCDWIDGYKVISIKNVLKEKKTLNREKDREIIKILENMTNKR